MADEKLSTKEALELKARAHHLNPIMTVGQQGPTETVIKETDAALTAHELIKVRIFGDDRTERIAICDALCEAVDAQPVQHIGKLLVLWRKNPEARDDRPDTSARKGRLRIFFQTTSKLITSIRNAANALSVSTITYLTKTCAEYRTICRTVCLAVKQFG